MLLCLDFRAIKNISFINSHPMTSSINDSEVENILIRNTWANNFNLAVRLIKHLDSFDSAWFSI